MASINNTVLATINHITLPNHISLADVQALDSVLSSWCELPVQVHVFDFKGVVTVPRAFYVTVGKFKKDVEAKKLKLVTINISDEMLRQLKSDGMDSALGYVKSLRLNDRPAAKDTIDETHTWLVKYAVESGRSAMDIMFSTTVAADENYRETPKDFRPENFFKVAMVRGRTAKCEVTFRLFFEKSTLLGLTNIIAQSTSTEPDQELLLSTATELLNIIYTTVKSRVNDERGYDLPPAIPVLIDPLQIVTNRSLTERGASWVPFVTPLGAFYLQIELEA